MLKINTAEFVTSVALGGEFIQGKMQIAMVGKSNVGKSSFINGICNQKKLAKTSASPGKTRLINYFDINRGQFYLVDLPGYGFAKAPKQEQEKWGKLIEDCLAAGNVKHIFLLLDCRHEPTALDRQMFAWIQYYCVPYTIIATKMDKIAKTKRRQAIAHLHKSIGAISPVIGFSAEDKYGLEDVLEVLEQVVLDEANV